ncbi:MAG TPA: YEATS-associated helix-containing protein [Candidatus Saccharimonadales bacterium]|jgi:hypothetical protein|nr:YEATS-associated helix-containing protein [Candidatus Saccharimonadales bacterium]
MSDVGLDGWRLFCTVVGIMLGMGLFGGAINFLLATKKDDPEKTKLKSVGAGLAASLLVPLFLKVIGSDLLTKKMVLTDLLVFGGFCLIAAISSKAFMKTLAERVLQQAQEANKTAQATKEEVKAQADRVEEMVSEPEGASAHTVSAANLEGAMTSAPSLNADSIKVLKALVDGRFVMRTFSGIAMDTRVPISQVANELAELAKNGLAQIVQRPNGSRAVITAQGKAALTNATSK